MLHTSISWLLLAAPFACCVWAAAGPFPGRRREGSSGPGDGDRPQIGKLNERLASLDSKLLMLAESNRLLAANLKSCTAQLCLAQAEIGNRKDELTCALARQGQLEELNREQQQELERSSVRLRAVEAELASRARAAESAGEGRAEGERALQARILEFEERLLAGQRELLEKTGQLVLAEQRLEELSSRTRATESAGERRAEGERALQARILDLDERLLAGQRELLEKTGQLALAEQRLEELTSRSRASESAGERRAEGERALQARILELEERLLAGQRERVEQSGQLVLAEQRCEELEAQSGRRAEELRLQTDARREAESRASEQERSQAALLGELEGRLAQRDEELRQRSAALKDLRGELADSASRAAERSRRCTELEEELRLQVEEQRQVEAGARELDQVLSARIADLEAGLRESSDERQVLASRIAELEAQLLLRERELHERSAAAENMRGQLDYGSREGDVLSVRCAELERQLSVREHELQVLRDEVTALSGRCEELSRTLEGRIRERNEHELQLAEASARIGELEFEVKQRAAQHAAELSTVDELAEGRLAAVLHGHAGQAPGELPPGYVEGLEQHDLSRALCSLLGGSAPLSSEALLRLGEHWRGQHAAWNSEPIEGQVVYLWADAPFVRVGLEPEGAALLVIVAGMVDGSRRVVSVEAGPRESAQAWLASLERLARRGMNVPRLVVAEDALGLWPALAQLGWDCAQQRCWDRRIEHVVASLPRRQQRKAGELLRALAKSETRAEANERKAAFVKRYRARRPDTVARLQSDWEQLLSLYSFPADHWPHLRTTAVVESLLTALRLQTSLSKPHPQAPNAEAILWKLLLIGARGLRKLNSPQLLPAVAASDPCSDGILGGRARGRAA